jgi:hypothetical protein
MVYSAVGFAGAKVEMIVSRFLRILVALGDLVLCLARLQRLVVNLEILSIASSARLWRSVVYLEMSLIDLSFVVDHFY